MARIRSEDSRGSPEAVTLMSPDYVRVQLLMNHLLIRFIRAIHG